MELTINDHVHPKTNKLLLTENRDFPLSPISIKQTYRSNVFFLTCNVSDNTIKTSTKATLKGYLCFIDLTFSAWKHYNKGPLAWIGSTKFSNRRMHFITTFNIMNLFEVLCKRFLFSNCLAPLAITCTN